MEDLDVTILVSTVDDYAAVWPGFCHGMAKYWPDSWPVVAMTNCLEFPCGWTIKTGDDLNWSNMMRAALACVGSPVVLFVTEDTWLTGPPDVEALTDFAGIISRGGADHVRLRPPLPGNERPRGDFPGDPRLYVLGDDRQQRCSLQAGLWSRAAFASLLGDDDLPGGFEWSASRKSRGSDRFLCVKEHGCLPHVTAGFEGWREAPVVRGLWTASAWCYARQEGIEIDFSENPKGGLR